MCQISVKVLKIRLLFKGRRLTIFVMHTLKVIIAVIFASLLFVPESHAVKMEFNFGFAYDHSTKEPLPELSDGFGYNLGACLWFKDKYGLAAGAVSTRHELIDASLSGQSFQIDSERDVIYFEGRYKFYRTKTWEFIAHLGYNANHKINGGDSSGSYVQFRDSANYDTNDIGYSGDGYWAGLTVYRRIQSFHRGYFVFLSFKYNLINYNKRRFLDTVVDINDTQLSFLIRDETETDYNAESFLINVGIVLRFDFSDL